MSIIALSEHHVDYMNRKGWSLRYYAERTFSPMCSSTGLGSCMAPGFWQTLISIVEVRKRFVPLLRLGRDRTVQIEAHGPEIPVVLLGNPA